MCGVSFCLRMLLCCVDSIVGLGACVVCVLYVGRMLLCCVGSFFGLHVCGVCLLLCAYVVLLRRFSFWS